MKIKTGQEAEFDVFSLGECMNRLSPPGYQRIEFIPVFEVYTGKGEYNVTRASARYAVCVCKLDCTLEGHDEGANPA